MGLGQPGLRTRHLPARLHIGQRPGRLFKRGKRPRPSGARLYGAECQRGGRRQETLVASLGKGHRVLGVHLRPANVVLERTRKRKPIE